MASVSLRQVRKSYDSHPVVHGVDLEVADQEFVVLVGPSGCGKSTLLRMIAGLEDITGGEIAIGDRVVNQVDPKDRDVAMVFQDYALYPHLTVFQNIAFSLQYRGVAKADIQRRVGEAAAILDIVPLLGRKPRQLSGGQRQRVAMGRAIVREPEVFLFDEPLSNLDAALRVSMRGELTALHQRLHATMIYVTHDQVEAMTMGTRICIMNGGRVEQVGAPLDVYRHPANTFVAGFLGSPPMNLVNATVALRGDHTGLSTGDQWVDAAALLSNLHEPLNNGAPVTLGIRPEDIAIGTGGSLSGVVINSEALGAETLVQLQLPGCDKTIRARADRDTRPAAGEVVPLLPDLGRVTLFDAQTGIALARR